MGRFLTGFGAAVLVAGAAWFFTGATPTGAQEKGKFGAPPRVVAQWEYKVVNDRTPTEAEMNQWGAEGWELVTSYHTGRGWPTHTFKRPK